MRELGGTMLSMKEVTVFRELTRSFNRSVPFERWMQHFEADDPRHEKLRFA